MDNRMLSIGSPAAPRKAGRSGGVPVGVVRAPKDGRIDELVPATYAWGAWRRVQASAAETVTRNRAYTTTRVPPGALGMLERKELVRITRRGTHRHAQRGEGVS